MVIEVKLLQSQKQLQSKEVTDEGIIIETKLLQP
jgi:hypothetical protein